MLMLQKNFIFLQNSTNIVTSFHLKAKLKKRILFSVLKGLPKKRMFLLRVLIDIFFGTPLNMSLFNDLAFYNPDSNIIIGPISPPNLFGQGVFQFWQVYHYLEVLLQKISKLDNFFYIFNYIYKQQFTIIIYTQKVINLFINK